MGLTLQGIFDERLALRGEGTGRERGVEETVLITRFDILSLVGLTWGFSDNRTSRPHPDGHPCRREAEATSGGLSTVM